ncbi:MAG: sugar phosphate isomerase/epimerase family protein [Chloroflexota bacterium]
MNFGVSLWNYRHYADPPGLRDIFAHVRQQGYGLELWSRLHGEEDVFEAALREGLTAASQGIGLSLHSAGLRTLDEHRRQLDLAAQLGARVVVVHPFEIASAEPKRPDLALTRELVAYAGERGLRLALENLHDAWHLPYLVEAAQSVARLGICLDIGHVYAAGYPLADFLAALGERIIHLHIHDVIAQADLGLPVSAEKHYDQHYQPGSGTIPADDWRLLAAKLGEVGFHGTAVLEIRPRDPMQTALLGRRFMNGLLGTQ